MIIDGKALYEALGERLFAYTLGQHRQTMGSGVKYISIPRIAALIGGSLLWVVVSTVDVVRYLEPEH